MQVLRSWPPVSWLLPLAVSAVSRMMARYQMELVWKPLAVSRVVLVRKELEWKLRLLTQSGPRSLRQAA
jgi:hypothetical protein